MPIVIARTGELNMVSTGSTPERRQAAWATIVQAWADRNPDRLGDLADKPADRSPAGENIKEF